MNHGPALLFCPADRLDRYEKADAAADSTVIDLEDAVSLTAKPATRQALVESHLDPQTTVVRVNPPGSGQLELDLAALRQTDYRTIMFAKAESAADIRALSDFTVIAICGSPRGVRFAADIADLENIAALTWGDEDLVAAIGGRSSRFDDGRFSDFARFARSQVLIAAASASKVAYDTAHLNISDVDGLRDEAEDAAASGFVGALCIHPSQVEIVRAAFRPGDADVERARAVLAAAEASPNSVFSFQGRMIDEPILRQARHIDEASR